MVTTGVGVADRQAAEFKSLAFQNTSGFERYGKRRVVFGKLRFDISSDLFIGSVVDINSKQQSTDDCDQQRPGNEEPDQINNTIEQRCYLGLLTARNAGRSACQHIREWEDRTDKSIVGSMQFEKANQLVDFGGIVPAGARCYDESWIVGKLCALGRHCWFFLLAEVWDRVVLVSSILGPL